MPWGVYESNLVLDAIHFTFVTSFVFYRFFLFICIMQALIFNSERSDCLCDCPKLFCTLIVICAERVE